MAETENRKAAHLPIKLVMPRQGKEKRNRGGGGASKPFRVVDETYRNRLSNEVSAIRESILPKISQVGTAPVRVKLLKNSIAKSHRPQTLFSYDTCPIIGVGKLGELFVKATERGLIDLERIIKENQTKQIVKELSCIEAIETITPAYRRKGVESNDILRKSPRGKEGFLTRVKLFDLVEKDDQSKHITDFEGICQARQIRINKSGYSADILVYSAECKNIEDVDALSKVVGVRSIMSMPTIRTSHPSSFDPKPLPKLFKREDIEGDVPVVVVVDTGISDKIPELNSWVVKRESYVAAQYRNTDHGTFVAGLICWGNYLNPQIKGIDENPCAIFDLQILPNDNPAEGETDSITEQEFLFSLEAALKQHANEYKVWNLSLSTEDICSLDDFSTFAEELDNFQDKYKVSFVISAGNFNTPPLLDYPRHGTQLDIGRITIPADSILGITVGSISHVDCTPKGPTLNDPSAFSRHGAGPNYIVKPDLVHYGGTCLTNGTHVSGIRSVNDNGTVERKGTSFSTPLVSKTLAQIYHQVTPMPNPILARALLTHHARDPRSQSRVPDNEEVCFGFGLPATVPYCLECTPYSSTLVFDDVLRPGYYLEWDDFPYPGSLYHNGKYYGEIWMTVAFAPTRGARWGSEYCETHIDAHFGVYRDRVNSNTGEITTKFHGLVPPEHKNAGLLYESYQVERLRKWAPVRTYYGDLGKNGERGNRWRLRLSLLTRHGIEKETFNPQPFSLIITISDPHKQAPVYDEMARQIRSKYQVQNIVLKEATRIQGRIE